MAGPTSTWTSTPNKKDNLTNGWTSKTLFNFQMPTADISVANATEVFGELIGAGFNYKGTNILPANYFAADNVGDSRTFKITMLFDKYIDGNDMNFNLGLYDIDNATAFEVGPRTATPIRSSSGVSLSKLEYYCCVFYDFANSNLIMSINGTIMYEHNGAGSQTTIIEPFNGSATLTNGSAVSYSLYIKNKCSDKIILYSLVVEEIG